MGEKRIERLIIILWIIMAIWFLPLIIERGFGQYTDTSITNTSVNITNAAPQVLNVDIPSLVSLTAYDNTTIQCNVTTYDYDNDSMNLNATLFYYTQSSVADEDQNVMYHNTSCSNISSQDYEINWTCTFNVNYFANNGTWYCNATATDTENATASNQSNAGVISSLLAIKTSNLVDFGELEVNEISNDSIANITNVGNRDINISVEGYAQSLDDGYAMNCTRGFIPVAYERYNITNESDYDFMSQLSIDATQIGHNFFVPQRLSETEESVNTTYWKISIPAGAGGFCTGRILFAAIDRQG